VDHVDDESSAPVLRLEGVEKTFPNGTQALRGVSFVVRAGSVHGLIGANGAGKSTLIKIVAGAESATGGSVLWKGHPTAWRSPGHARSAGLATLYQHIPLVPTLSVLENVFLDRGGWRRTPNDQRRQLAALCERVQYEVDPDVLVERLPIGSRQMVALFQALAAGAEMIVMDEPTASLAETERQVVFDVVRRLSAAGTTFLYVSHFLDEITELTDAVTVIRDGRVVLDTATAEVDEQTLAAAVAGRQLFALENAPPPTSSVQAPVVLAVRDLTTQTGLRDITLEAREGEVVGIAGLLGSGRTELLRAVFGADPRTGTVTVAGRSVGAPADAVRAGIALVPEDRVQQGLFPQLPLWKNISVTDLDAFARAGVPVESREQQRAADGVRDLGIVTPGVDALPGELSGGNAQKVVFAKWVYTGARLWLLDEPTAGVDVGAKADILRLVRDFARSGQAVLVVSSEFEELLAVSTRILVLREGRIVAERRPTDTSEEELIMLANGIGAVAPLGAGTPLDVGQDRG
jgi:ribose transport system ATP-binding protein